MSTANGSDPGKSFAHLRQVWQSALPHAQKVVLQLLLSYARPDFTVYHSEGEIAWELGYTTPTVYTALKQLRALQVLTVLFKARQQYATEYRIDLTKLPAPRPYPKRRTRPQPINHLYAEPKDDPGQPINDLYPETAQTINDSAQGINHLHPIDIRETKEESYFLGDPDPAPTTPPKKEGDRSRAKTRPKTQTPAPDTLDLTPELHTWALAHTPEVDLVYQRDKFLQYCRGQGIENVDWLEAFKGWLLEAIRRPTSNRPGPDPIAARVRAQRLAAVDAPPKPMTCSWDGCGAPPCGHGPQTCRAHGPGCEGCAAERRAEMAVDAVLDLDTTVELSRGHEVDEAVSEDDTPVPSAVEVTAEAEGIPVAVVDALAGALAQQHAMPPTHPPPRPWGSAPPERVSPRSFVRQLLAEPDQPTLAEALAKRRARQAQRQPALAAD
jgi:hypothetical protein